MSQPRSKYQVQYREVIDEHPEDWRNYGSLLTSEAAARSRTDELMLIRPTRKYRIVRVIVQVTHKVLWQSEEQQKA